MGTRKSGCDKIEAIALNLYDRLNPDSDNVVLVSKAECLRRARALVKLPKH